MIKTTFRPIGLAVMAASLAMLAGCAVVAPDTARLAADVTPASWSTDALPAGESEVFRDFWTRWQDPTLSRLVERARAANTDVLSAVANLRAARASVMNANSILWPTAALGGSGNRQRSGGHTTTDYGADLSGAWTLNLAGSEYQQRDAAEAEALASGLTLESTRELVAAQTAQAYVNLRAALAQRQVVMQSIQNYAETARVAEWQYQAGTGTASEAEDARTQWANARARVPEIERSIQEYRNAIARLTAMPVDELNLGEEAAIPVPPEGAAVSIPAETIMRRADVGSALATLEAKVLRLKSAKSDFFPTLKLTGNIGTAAGTIGALGASGTGVAGLAAALSLPVLNRGSLMAAEETAAAELDRARSDYVATLLTALEETDNALAGISSAERRSGDLEVALRHARTAALLARLEYESGIGDYTMLLSTERSRLSAEESLLSNQAERANQYVVLYRALGGAWAFDAVPEGTAATVALEAPEGAEETEQR